jgi:hypothetical protein
MPVQLSSMVDGVRASCSTKDEARHGSIEETLQMIVERSVSYAIGWLQFAIEYHVKESGCLFGHR